MQIADPVPTEATPLPLVCLLCRAPIVTSASGASGGCATCRNVPLASAEYPEVGGVKMMIPGASALLAATWVELERQRERFDGQGDEPPVLLAATPARTAERYRAMRAAERCNLELLERSCQPIGDYLGAERTIMQGLGAALAIQLSGWSIGALLSYFHQDWTPNDGRRFMAARMLRLLARHDIRRDSLAVVGCGAGGLVAALAPQFSSVLGVDLSIPCLLLARQLLDGGAFRVAPFPENPSFVEVEARGAEPPPGNVTLAVADGGDLPLPDGCLTCVTTQYFLDIVPDPAAIAAEINRVLAPGGVWINHGPPFRLASDPPALRVRTELDLPALLDGFGFAPLESETLAHEPIDLDQVIPLATIRLYPVLSFVARKTRTLPPPAASAAFAAYFTGDKQALLGLSARLKPGEAVRYLLGTEVQAGRSRPGSLFAVGRRALTTLTAPVTNPPIMAALVNACLQRLDGNGSVADVARDLYMDSNGLVTEEDFVLSLRVLRNLGWVEVFSG
jgi:SAM-dependent methyltransferase